MEKSIPGNYFYPRVIYLYTFRSPLLSLTPEARSIPLDANPYRAAY